MLVNDEFSSERVRVTDIESGFFVLIKITSLFNLLKSIREKVIKANIKLFATGLLIRIDVKIGLIYATRITMRKFWSPFIFR